MNPGEPSVGQIAAMLQRALTHHHAGELRAAEAIYREILDRVPNEPDALHLLGLLAHQAGEHEQALALIDRAIAVKPGAPEYYNNRAQVLCVLDRLDEAVAAYQQACTLDPQYAEAHNSLGIVLQAQGRAQDAIAAFRQALRANPDFAEAHYNLGNALHECGRLSDAIACYRQALALMPGDAEAHNNLGIALKDKSELNAAMAAFDRALALRPDFAQAHANKGMALLVTGKFEQGWREYAWRFVSAGERRAFTQTQWDGADFRDHTLLVHAEQGLGDTIQFARYLPLIKARGGRVLLACQRPVQSLLEDLAGVDALVDDLSHLSPGSFDLQVALLNVPGILGTTLQTIPNDVPYLSVKAALVSKWRACLGSGTYNVGICWAGLPEHLNDRNRSIALATFAPLGAVPEVTFYSLQKGPAAAQTAQGGITLVDHTDELTDFAETAALITNLDLVISVDTAVAHLSGALAKPVWTLLPYAPDWRWLLDRQDSPWYPTMRLFRQPRPGDWGSVMEAIAKALATVVHPQKSARD
jgi:tetratricopeptide (TPR) repeat protein